MLEKGKYEVKYRVYEGSGKNRKLVDKIGIVNARSRSEAVAAFGGARFVTSIFMLIKTLVILFAFSSQVIAQSSYLSLDVGGRAWLEQGYTYRNGADLGISFSVMRNVFILQAEIDYISVYYEGQRTYRAISPSLSLGAVAITQSASFYFLTGMGFLDNIDGKNNDTAEIKGQLGTFLNLSNRFAVRLNGQIGTTLQPLFDSDNAVHFGGASVSFSYRL